MTYQQNQKTKIVTIMMPTVLHKKLEAIAALQGISLKDLILRCLQEKLLGKEIKG